MYTLYEYLLVPRSVESLGRDIFGILKQDSQSHPDTDSDGHVTFVPSTTAILVAVLF